MDRVKYWYLKNHNLFSQMNEGEIKALCVISGFKKGIKNEVIYFADDLVRRIYLVKKGMVKIAVSDEQGNEIIKEIVQPGDLFGEIGLSRSPHTESEYARVITDEAAICSFTLDDFEHVLKQNPTISLKYTKQVGDKIRVLENRYTNLVFKDVRTRLIDYLKEFVRSYGKAEDNRYTVRNYLTHQDLASLTGSTRQTVTSILNQLEKENLLSYTRSHITIFDLNTFK